MTQTGLVLDDLTITKNGAPLISVSAEIAPGAALSVMGPSGIGKSTLLAAITGTLAPAFQCSGHIWLNGRDITGLPPQKRHAGILFQDEMLFPHLSVAGNLAFGLPANIKGRAARRKIVYQALEDIGLNDYCQSDPATLSGGQKARVALMRMLLSNPQALLLDEPFSRLDATLRAQIRDLVFRHARTEGLPVLLVTHDRADAEAAGGDIIELGAA